MREPQPHSHKRPVDENEVPRNACTQARKPRQWHMQCKWHGNMIWAYTNMREPQPHSHKRPMNENEVPRNACTRAQKPRQLHTQCKWHGNVIWNAPWTYTNMREPQPHSHKRPMDENEVPRNACTRARKPRQWHMQCNGMEIWYANMLMDFQKWKVGENSPEMRRKHTRCRE